VKHFGISEWMDYVCQHTPSAESCRMKAHLDSGCPSCTATVRRLEKLAAVIAADNSREVPEHVVHNAQRIFALQLPDQATLSIQLARLVYDSFREPPPAGVRSGQRPSRRAVYQAGDFCVDLRLDREDGGQVNLVGQVGHCTVPAKAVASVRVSLMAGRRVIAQALSNENGEFHFEYQPAPHLRLHVPLDSTCYPIEVSLQELSDGHSGRDDEPADKEEWAQ
jgi:hypothetical protein